MPIANRLTTIALTLALSLAPAITRAESVEPAPAPSIATVDSAYGKLPLSFEVNQGQVDLRSRKDNGSATITAKIRAEAEIA